MAAPKGPNALPENGPKVFRSVKYAINHSFKSAMAVGILMLILTACSQPTITRFDDTGIGDSLDRSPKKVRYITRGDILTIKPMEQMGVWLADVDVQLIESNIYLYPINISSPGPQELQVDFSNPKIPRDWKDRLYWIENISSYPFSSEQTIYRKRIILDLSSNDLSEATSQ